MASCLGRSRRWLGCQVVGADRGQITFLAERADELCLVHSVHGTNPAHGGAVMKPVGSMAVRDAILKHQPMLSVHGHIHESRAIKRLGRTMAINPGSVYGDGVLQGAVLELDAKKAKVSKYLLVNG